jgi:hypothetical protein
MGVVSLTLIRLFEAAALWIAVCSSIVADCDVSTISKAGCAHADPALYRNQRRSEHPDRNDPKFCTSTASVVILRLASVKVPATPWPTFVLGTVYPSSSVDVVT